MCKRFMWVGLFTMSVVAMLGTKVNAGCIPLGGGGQYCADWITGSEICNGKAAGIKKVCDQAGNCNAKVLCAAGGTFDASTGLPTAHCNATDSFFPTAADNCGIEGVGFCLNPADKSSQGQPFILNTILAGVAEPFECTKNGSCKFTAELIPESKRGACVNPNWRLVDFTAAEFKAKSCYCPGSYNTATPPECMPSDPSGVETCLKELCTVDLTGFQVGETRPYSCTSLQ